MIVSDILMVVESLNQIVNENNFSDKNDDPENTPSLFEFSSDGDSHCISFMGIHIWHSWEEDEDINSTETFEEYLKEQAKNVIEDIANIEI
jgi:hypothetical protein